MFNRNIITTFIISEAKWKKAKTNKNLRLNQRSQQSKQKNIFETFSPNKCTTPDHTRLKDHGDKEPHMNHV